jgi:hypothetical protein
LEVVWRLQRFVVSVVYYVPLLWYVYLSFSREALVQYWLAKWTIFGAYRYAYILNAD